jgi:DNA-binding HxlR family transcriptional regulator
VAASEATGRRFRARAGTLTLLFAWGSTDRRHLLETLCGEEADDGLFDFDDEPGLMETLPPVLRESRSGIAPRSLTKSMDRGEELLFVTFTLERWLDNRPDGPLKLGPEGAAAIASLVRGWSVTIVHALAAEPLTLAELERSAGAVSHETVAEQVEAMERAGQIEALPGGGEARYALTDWGREGIAPIVAAVRYERHYPEDDVLPPDVFDVEAAFQMALPLLRLPPDPRGSCRLGVRIPGEEPLLVGATAQVDEGRVVSSSPLLDNEPEAWAAGSPLDWCETVVDPATARLTLGGDTRLAGNLLEALHERLFG